MKELLAIRTDAMLDELEVRTLSRSQRRKLREVLDGDDEMPALDDYETPELIYELELRLGYSLPEAETLDDKIKLEHFCEVFDNYTASEIENLLPAK